MIKFKIEDKSYKLPDVINIEDYVKIFKVKDLFTEEYFPAKIVNMVTGAPLEDLKEGGYAEISYLAKSIIEMLPKEDDLPFVERFKIDDVDYGFFPDWKGLTFAEWMDLDTLISKPQDEILNHLHILAAIMYRPIVNERSKHDFDIEEYDIDEMKVRAELFKKRMDVSIILAASVFFCKLEKKLNQISPTSLMKTKLNLWDTIKMIWMMWRMYYKIRSNKPMAGTLLSEDYAKMILRSMNTSIKKI